jgi:hypothetical protein
VAIPKFSGLVKSGKVFGNRVFYRLHRRSIPPNLSAFNSEKLAELSP